MQLSLLAPRGIAQGSAASRTSCFSYCSSSRPQACRLQLRRSFCGGARLRQEVSNGAKCSAFFKLGGQTSAGGGEPASLACAIPDFYLRARLPYRKNAMELCPLSGYCATAIGSGILCEGHLGLRGTRTEFQFGILFGTGSFTVEQETLIQKLQDPSHDAPSRSYAPGVH